MKFSFLSIAFLLPFTFAAPMPLNTRGTGRDILAADFARVQAPKDHILHHSSLSENVNKRAVPAIPSLRIKGPSHHMSGFAGKFRLFGGSKQQKGNTLFKMSRNKNVVKDGSKGAHGRNFRMNQVKGSNRRGRILSPDVKIVINRGS